MMRKPWGGLCAAILLVGVVAMSGLAATKSKPEATGHARLLVVKAVEQAEGTSLQVLTSAPFSYTSYQPHARNVVVDLAGVVSGPAGLDGVPPVGWMADYRLLPFRNASGRPVLRLDINLKQDCKVELYQPDRTALRISCPAATETAAAATPASPALSVDTAGAPAVTAEPVKVRRVIVQEQESGLTLDIEATGSLRYETLTLNNPTRLVVDLPQSILVASQRSIVLGEDGAVAGVRMAQFKAQPPVTRVVLDLREMLPYEVKATQEGVRVTLQYPAAAAAPVVPAAEPTGSAADDSAPAETAAEAEESAPVLVASLAPTLPGSLASVSAQPVKVEPLVLASAAPATPLTPAASPAPAEPIAANTSTTAPPAAPPAPQEAAAAQRAPKFSGEPISVNLKDVDLKDFFRLIHEISGLNIIVDPNVSGAVTLVLIDVPWDQALDIVLRNNGLSSTLEGNVLRIATRATLKKEQEEQRDLSKARAEAVDPITTSRRLSYARAGDLEPILKRFLSSRGEIIRDERTNTLIIRDIPSVIPEVDNIIQQLDRKSLQVEIEARVVTASRAFSREIGSQFASSTSAASGRSVFGGALGASPFTSTLPPPLVSGAAGGGGGSAQPLISSFPVAATSGFLFGHRSPNFALDVILTAAESRNIAKVLSKPRVITQNNVTAEVKQGTRIPVQTVVNNTISTQFIDVVLRLNVTPQITVEGTVFLNIVIENQSIDAGIARINGIPALATQSTTTQVLIPDGGTVVVGGVMVTSNSTSIDQVPLLGSIPIIGHLFKRTTVDTSTRELLFFITPRILQG